MRILRKQDRARGRNTTDIMKVPPYPAPPITPKRGIRRLMKRDPANGLQLPSTDAMTSTVGTSSGVSPASTVGGHMDKPNPDFGSGRKVIKDRGTNKRLKRN